jgi:protein-tyrosine phosphatase
LVGLAKNKTDRTKVHLILNELFPNQNREVPDPYYGGAQGFEEVYQLLEAACSLIASKLT